MFMWAPCVTCRMNRNKLSQKKCHSRSGFLQNDLCSATLVAVDMYSFWSVAEKRERQIQIIAFQQDKAERQALWWQPEPHYTNLHLTKSMSWLQSHQEDYRLQPEMLIDTAANSTICYSKLKQVHCAHHTNMSPSGGKRKMRPEAEIHSISGDWDSHKQSIKLSTIGNAEKTYFLRRRWRLLKLFKELLQHLQCKKWPAHREWRELTSTSWTC